MYPKADAGILTWAVTHKIIIPPGKSVAYWKSMESVLRNKPIKLLIAAGLFSNH